MKNKIKEILYQIMGQLIKWVLIFIAALLILLFVLGILMYLTAQQ